MPASSKQQEHAVERAGKIFTVLKQCAAQKLPCPSYVTLARRYGVQTRTIKNAMHFLASNAMIEIEGGQNDRVVTIRATGQKTATPVLLKERPNGRKKA